MPNKKVLSLHCDSEMRPKVVRRQEVSGRVASGTRQTDVDCRKNKINQPKKFKKKGKAYGSKKSTIRNQHS